MNSANQHTGDSAGAEAGEQGAAAGTAAGIDRQGSPDGGGKYSPFQLARKYIWYYLTAANGKGHGIHSPFVFDLVIHVLNDSRVFPEYAAIERLRRQLESDPTILRIEDMGAGSASGPSAATRPSVTTTPAMMPQPSAATPPGVTTTPVMMPQPSAATRPSVMPLPASAPLPPSTTLQRSISDIARRMAKPKKLGQLLFRIARYYRSERVLELGTSLGLSTAYLAAGSAGVTAEAMGELRGAIEVTAEAGIPPGWKAEKGTAEAGMPPGGMAEEDSTIGTNAVGLQPDKSVEKGTAEAGIPPGGMAEGASKIGTDAVGLQPDKSVEKGTAEAGILLRGMAEVKSAARVFTIEGASEVAAAAENNFRTLGLENIECTIGNFDQVLEGTLARAGRIDLAFIDGNHRLEPTLRYFDALYGRLSSSAVVIFDDIHWSREMEEAWESIKKDPRVYLSVDLFFIGLVFFRDSFKVKQDFVIRF